MTELTDNWRPRGPLAGSALLTGKADGEDPDPATRLPDPVWGSGSLPNDQDLSGVYIASPGAVPELALGASMEDTQVWLDKRDMGGIFGS